MAIRGFLADLWESAFGEEIRGYRSRVMYETTIDNITMIPAADEESFPQTLSTKSLFYTVMTFSGSCKKPAVAEVSDIYTDKISVRSDVTLLEKERRFLCVPFRSYELVLSDGTRIPAIDFVWGDNPVANPGMVPVKA